MYLYLSYKTFTALKDLFFHSSKVSFSLYSMLMNDKIVMFSFLNKKKTWKLFPENHQLQLEYKKIRKIVLLKTHTHTHHYNVCIHIFLCFSANSSHTLSVNCPPVEEDPRCNPTTEPPTTTAEITSTTAKNTAANNDTIQKPEQPSSNDNTVVIAVVVSIIVVAIIVALVIFIYKKKCRREGNDDEQRISVSILPVFYTCTILYMVVKQQT